MQQLRVFYVHASVAATGMVLIFIVNLATNVAAGITGEWWAWWSAWAFIGWSLALAVHGLVVRLDRPTQASSTWEQRQIEKVLAR
ncbi:MAG: 2TM domain-containing protein [Actinomycetia bacterium]|nr:2TM domain-containing protein [Actinomycetes bacterium]MCP4084856.1 2TM domain-containing protein [Actinomycetes bacterium]MCP5027300.1 2TM domain-containing protein [Actinomycetes bacterium]